MPWPFKTNTARNSSGGRRNRKGEKPEPDRDLEGIEETDRETVIELAREAAAVTEKRKAKRPKRNPPKTTEARAATELAIEAGAAAGTAWAASAAETSGDVGVIAAVQTKLRKCPGTNGFRLTTPINSHSIVGIRSSRNNTMIHRDRGTMSFLFLLLRTWTTTTMTIIAWLPIGDATRIPMTTRNTLVASSRRWKMPITPKSSANGNENGIVATAGGREDLLPMHHQRRLPSDFRANATPAPHFPVCFRPRTAAAAVGARSP